MRSKYNWFLTVLLVLLVQVGYAQEKTLTGVVQEGGLTLPGVSVVIEGTQFGTQTDLDGKYSIKVKQGQTLVFSFIGMQDVKYKVGAAASHNVTMAADESNLLDEVIVVGYGTATKDAFTGSVSQVDSKQIEKKSVSNAVAALSGEAAGVRVISTSGQPGSEPTVRIRGFGSVNGNRSPLYIVDGVPYLGNISSINPSDIESMNVLKDATATAIYGSRGANGVVIINTKSGKGSDSFIQVEAKTGVNWRALPRYSTIKSPEEYIAYSHEGLRNYGKIKGGFTDEQARAWADKNLFNGDYGINANYNMWNVANGAELIDPATGQVRQGVTRKYNPENWEDHAFQSSNRTEASLTMGGSADKTSYYTSMGYLKDEGYSVNSDYERMTARLNLQHKPKDWLTAKMNVGYTFSQSNNGGQTSDSGSVFWFTDNIPSIYPLFLRDENGKKVKDVYGGYEYDYGRGRGFGALTNAIGDVHYGKDKSRKHDVVVNANFVVDLYDGLTFETNIGGQYYNNVRDRISNRYYGSAATMGGSIYKVTTELFTYNWTKMLRYKNVFGAHGLEVLAAHENSTYEAKYNMISKNDLADPDSTDLNNGAKSTPPGGYSNEYNIESYFAQVNYDYAGKYFLSGTVRRDGSSRFRDNKWGTFGSVGLSWVASREDFMLKQDLISHLKLKASYGLTGDQSSYASINGVNQSAYYPGENLWEVSTYGGSLAIYEIFVGNPALTWEKSKMFQVGADISLKRFLDVSVDYYLKNTDDLIFSRKVGPSAGYDALTVNDGQLRNQGLEFNVTAHLLQKEDAFIDLSVNGEYLKNELKKMPIDPSTGIEKVIDISGIYGRSVGHSIGDFYMREWAGVDSQTGQAQWYTYTYTDAAGNTKHVGSLVDFLDQNPEMADKLTKETTYNYADATLQYVGKSAIPKLRGGINLNAGYKGWEFSIQALYSLGGYAYDYTYAGLMGNRQVGSNNWHTDIANRWQKPGDVTDVPRISSNADVNTNGTSTRFLTKSDYLSINNIRLGYNLPKTFIDQLGLSSVSFYVSGDNLFLFTKRDGFNPAISEFGSSSTYNYTPITTVTGGVKVKF
ncbi:SusC/RagA family TonB-linked outer membrane protein [Myroides pelagicus]|uniref:SusC/RagA family TonB-linked outer membrane protein n=1 Tax=Myroides pelagicus TaxID=270914 RepID=A0A7K1GIV1_9FLAO|nr:SusC/RagA family TonB-linked outer membrane protein [Myroides pelagicus]MEC4113721.1 SusC/RagA family TonB-linked outer membrane protein [Myroides pelagicus]MTH28821.1 SusC/RagA family TonB-linked outer membrane protein [Myroides pelagicus]